MVSTRIAAILVALAFVSGAFIASPELRAYAAATITSADIVDGTIRSVDIGSGEVKTSDVGNGQVTSAKIKDGNVMTSDLANDAVTSDKLADNVFDDLQGQIDALTAENVAQQTEIDDLTARVEALEGGGTDPNDVDDDSDGYTENQGDCDDNSNTVNPAGTEVGGNGVDDNCDGAIDNTPDTYEPNDSVGTAYDIGSVAGGILANMHTTSDEDWYSKQFTSNAPPNVGTFYVQISLTQIPAGSNYDLYVTCDQCTITSSSSTNAGNTGEVVNMEFVDNTPSATAVALFKIEVRNISDTTSGDEYFLSASPGGPP